MGVTTVQAVVPSHMTSVTAFRVWLSRVTVAAVQALQADMQAQIDLLRAQVQQLRVAAKK